MDPLLASFPGAGKFLTKESTVPMGFGEFDNQPKTPKVTTSEVPGLLGNALPKANRIGGYFLKSPSYSRDIWYAMYKKMERVVRSFDSDQAKWFAETNLQLVFPGVSAVKQEGLDANIKSHLHHFWHYQYMVNAIVPRVVTMYTAGRLQGLNYVEDLSGILRSSQINRLTKALTKLPVNTNIVQPILDALQIVHLESPQNGVTVFLPLFAGDEDSLIGLPNPAGDGNRVGGIKRQATAFELQPLSPYLASGKTDSAGVVSAETVVDVAKRAVPKKRMGQETFGYAFNALLRELQDLLEEFIARYVDNSNPMMHFTSKKNEVIDFWASLGWVNGFYNIFEEAANMARELPVVDYDSFVDTNFKYGREFGPQQAVIDWSVGGLDASNRPLSAKLLIPFDADPTLGIRSDLSTEQYIRAVISDSTFSDYIGLPETWSSVPRELPYVCAVPEDTNSAIDWVTREDFIRLESTRILGLPGGAVNEPAGADPNLNGRMVAFEGVNDATASLHLFGLMSKTMPKYFDPMEGPLKSMAEDQTFYINEQMVLSDVLMLIPKVTKMIDPMDLHQHSMFIMIDLEKDKANYHASSWEGFPHILDGLDKTNVAVTTFPKWNDVTGTEASLTGRNIGPVSYDYGAYFRRMFMPVGDHAPYSPFSIALRLDTIFTLESLSEFANEEIHDIMIPFPWRPLGPHPFQLLPYMAMIQKPLFSDSLTREMGFVYPTPDLVLNTNGTVNGADPIHIDVSFTAADAAMDVAARRFLPNSLMKAAYYIQPYFYMVAPMSRAYTMSYSYLLGKDRIIEVGTDPDVSGLISGIASDGKVNKAESADFVTYKEYVQKPFVPYKKESMTSERTKSNDRKDYGKSRSRDKYPKSSEKRYNSKPDFESSRSASPFPVDRDETKSSRFASKDDQVKPDLDTTDDKRKPYKRGSRR